MKIFSLQEKQQTIEGSALFARFLKEPSKDALCYKTVIHTPSLYHIRMLIKAKQRSAAPHSLGGIYSVLGFCAHKALCKRQKEISLHSQWDLYEGEKPAGFFSSREYFCPSSWEKPLTSLLSVDGVYIIIISNYCSRNRRNNPSSEQPWSWLTGGFTCFCGIQNVHFQLHTHKLCSLFPVLPAPMRHFKLMPGTHWKCTGSTLKGLHPCFWHLIMLHRNKMINWCGSWLSEGLMTSQGKIWPSKYSWILLFFFLFEQMLPMNYSMRKAGTYVGEENTGKETARCQGNFVWIFTQLSKALGGSSSKDFILSQFVEWSITDVGKNAFGSLQWNKKWH